MSQCLFYSIIYFFAHAAMEVKGPNVWLTISFKIYSCVLQKNEMYAGLEQHEDD